MTGSPLEDLAILLLAALVPSLVFLSWVRASERYGKEPWGTVLGLFGYGALFATFIAVILELVILNIGSAASTKYPAPEFSFLNPKSSASTFFLALVVAPFVEEALKASGVVRSASTIRSVADGPVFGASVGLGFGFFETLLYGLGAYVTGGLVAGVALILVRSISSVLLHGSSTAMFGYGYATMKLHGRTGSGGGYYLLAVAMHASYNALSSLGAIAAALGVAKGLDAYAGVLGLVLAILFAVAAINHVVTVIHRSSFPSAVGAPPKYQPPSIRGPRRPPADPSARGNA